MRKSTKTSFLSAVLCYNETNIKGFHEVQSQEVVIMTRGIRVKNTDDIQKINKIVTRYGFDIWIHGKSGMVDAEPARYVPAVPERAASDRSRGRC